MTLTKADYELLADAAEKYPPGHGASFFSDCDVGMAFAAERRCETQPAVAAEFG